MTTDPRTVDGYNAGAKAYQDHIKDPVASPLHEYYEKPAIRALLPELTGLRVLSLGCGSGEDAAWLKRQGAARVLGVDVSAGLIEIARATHPGVEFEVSDIESFSYQADSWDLIYSSLAMHYISDWSESFSRIAASLKPGGHFIFSANHPIETALESFTTASSRGVRLGRQIDNATEVREIWGDYMALADGGIRKRQSTVADNQIVYSYHRTFAQILRAIRDSGLVMVDFVEPTPLDDMRKHNPEHFKQVSLTPKFFICSLQKVAKT